MIRVTSLNINGGFRNESNYTLKNNIIIKTKYDINLLHYSNSLPQLPFGMGFADADRETPTLTASKTNLIILLQDTRGPQAPFFPGGLEISSLKENTISNINPSHPSSGGVHTIVAGPITKYNHEIIFIDYRFLLIVRLHSLTPLLIINAYLPSLSSESAIAAKKRYFQNPRIYLLNRILEAIEDNKDCLVIMGGDLNTQFDQKMSKEEKRLWVKINLTNINSVLTSSDLGYTFPARQTTIDHILLSPCQDLRPISLAYSSSITDHNYVIAEVEATSIDRKTELPSPLLFPCWDTYSLTTSINTRVTRDMNLSLNSHLLRLKWIAEKLTPPQKSVLPSPPDAAFFGNLLSLLLRIEKEDFNARKLLTTIVKLRSHSISSPHLIPSASFLLEAAQKVIIAKAKGEDYVPLLTGTKNETQRLLSWSAHEDRKISSWNKKVKLEEALLTRLYKRVIRSTLERRPTSVNIEDTLDEEGKRIGNKKAVLRRIGAHLESIATNNNARPDLLPIIYPLVTDPPPAATLSREHLENMLKHMKPTTPGKTKFHINYIKKADEDTRNLILDLLIEAWETKHVPSSWLVKKIVLLPKVEKPTFKDYRPISLIEPPRKLLVGALVKSQFLWNRVSPFQFGFRPGTGVDNASAILHSTIIQANRNASSLIIISLDFAKAFDRLPWNILPELMSRVGVHEEVTKFALDMEVKGRCELDEGISYRTKAGSPQGSIAAPLLWAGAMNPLLLKLDKLKEERKPNMYSYHVTYADDICLLAEGYEEAHLLLGLVDEFLLVTGLTLSSSKCVVSWNDHFIPQPHHTWRDFQVIGKEAFKHLGRYISPLSDPQPHPKLHQKVYDAQRAMAILHKNATSATMIRYVCNSVIWPLVGHALTFQANSDHLVKLVDKTYKQIIKRKLYLHNSFPDTLVIFPLGQHYLGSRPFFVYLGMRKITTLHRLLYSSEVDRWSASILCNEGYLNSFLSHKNHRHVPGLCLGSGEDHSEDSLREVEMVDYLHTQKYKVKATFQEALNPNKLCIVLHFASKESHFTAKTTTPWHCSLQDKTRCYLSALLIMCRLGTWSQDLRFEFSLDLLKRTLSAGKKHKALKIANSDLLGEIYKLWSHSSITYVNSKTPRKKSFIDTKDVNFVFNTEDISTPHIRHGHSANTTKEIIAKKEFKDYLALRDEKYAHHSYKWSDLPFVFLADFWCSINLDITLKGMKILMNHEWCESTKLKRMQQRKPKSTTLNAAIEGRKMDEEDEEDEEAENDDIAPNPMRINRRDPLLTMQDASIYDDAAIEQQELGLQKHLIKCGVMDDPNSGQTSSSPKQAEEVLYYSTSTAKSSSPPSITPITSLPETHKKSKRKKAPIANSEKKARLQMEQNTARKVTTQADVRDLLKLYREEKIAEQIRMRQAKILADLTEAKEELKKPLNFLLLASKRERKRRQQLRDLLQEGNEALKNIRKELTKLEQVDGTCKICNSNTSETHAHWLCDCPAKESDFFKECISLAENRFRSSENYLIIRQATQDILNSIKNDPDPETKANSCHGFFTPLLLTNTPTFMALTPKFREMTLYLLLHTLRKVSIATWKARCKALSSIEEDLFRKAKTQSEAHPTSNRYHPPKILSKTSTYFYSHS